MCIALFEFLKDLIMGHLFLSFPPFFFFIVCSNDRKYIVLGLEHGEIRVCRVNPQDEADFSDYWTLAMHDNFNGYVSSIRLSYDRKMLLTCGYDGNIFSFFINDSEPIEILKMPVRKDVVMVR